MKPAWTGEPVATSLTPRASRWSSRRRREAVRRWRSRSATARRRSGPQWSVRRSWLLQWSQPRSVTRRTRGRGPTAGSSEQCGDRGDAEQGRACVQELLPGSKYPSPASPHDVRLTSSGPTYVLPVRTHAGGRRSRVDSGHRASAGCCSRGARRSPLRAPARLRCRRSWLRGRWGARSRPRVVGYRSQRRSGGDQHRARGSWAVISASARSRPVRSASSRARISSRTAALRSPRLRRSSPRAASTAARSRLFAHLGIPPHGRSLAARLRRSPASKLSERASVSATARRDSRRRGQARCQSGGIAARASRSATSCSPRMSASHDRQSAMKIGSPSSRSPGSRGTAPRAQPRPHLGRERGPPRWPRSGAPAAFALRSWSPPVEAAGPRWRVRPVDPTATSPACASSRRRPPAQAPTDASGPRSARAPQTPADTCGGARTRCAGSAYCTRARTRRCRAPPARRPLRHRRRGQHRRSACRSGMPG